MSVRVVDIFKDESYDSTEPVSLGEAKQQIFVDFSDDDVFISNLISQSRAAIETYCGISILSKTLTITLQSRPDFPLSYLMPWYDPNPTVNHVDQGIGTWFELPYGPVKSVSSVTSVDYTGSITTLDNNVLYHVSGTSFLKMRVDVCSDNVLVIYYTGYPSCPPDLKLAILNEIAFRYEQRGNSTNRYASQNVGASEGSQALAAPFRRIVV